jgi:hypothetical protein
MKTFRVAGTFEMVLNSYCDESVRDTIERLETSLPDGQGFHLHINSINEVKDAREPNARRN